MHIQSTYGEKHTQNSHPVHFAYSTRTFQNSTWIEAKMCDDTLFLRCPVTLEALNNIVEVALLSEEQVPTSRVSEDQ